MMQFFMRKKKKRAISLTENTQLVAEDNGKSYSVDVDGVVVTLPLSSTISNGWMVTIKTNVAFIALPHATDYTTVKMIVSETNYDYISCSVNATIIFNGTNFAVTGVGIEGANDE